MPLAVALLEDAVDDHRNLGCPQYERCLDDAIRQGWASFSCAQCPLNDGRASTRLADFALGRREVPLL